MTTQHSVPTDPSYCPDKPVSTPGEDLYHRMPVARGISQCIAGLPKGECFVIGLNGPWGDGKTSVLRFVEHELNLRQPQDFVPVWFNPWRVGGVDGLLFEFFHTLADAGKIATKSKFAEATEAIARYARLLRPLGPLANLAATAIAPGSTALVDAGRAMDSAAEYVSQFGEPTVEAIHEKLCKQLSALDRRIVVFIDDIDRLAADEVVSLFRLIKACADLPNITYVLAFDREMVARTLAGRLVAGRTEAGRRYLEKIIQIHVALPPAARGDLDRACTQRIDAIVTNAGVPISASDMLRWEVAYRDGIARRLRTPRQVGQYLNAIRFAIPLLAGEVNAIDLLVLEGLRVCFPKAYEVVRLNLDAFIGVPSHLSERRHGNSLHDDLLAGVKGTLTPAESDALDRIVGSLFPRYHASRRIAPIGWGSDREWTTQKRICSPAYGSRYFAYAIGSGDVADADVAAILELAEIDSSTLLTPRIEGQLDPLKQGVLVAKLDERKTQLSPAGAGRVATALALCSGSFDEPFSVHSYGHPGVAAARLAGRLCAQITDPLAREAAACDVVEHSASPWFAAAFMRMADPRQAGAAKEEALLGGDALETLRKAFLEVFKRLKATETPMLDLERRWKFEMLFLVAQAGGRSLLENSYLSQARTDGNIAVRMLQCLTQPRYSSNELIPSPEDFEPRHLDTLALLVDLDAWAKVVLDSWIPSHLQKTPAEWEGMKPDDRILAQFWHHYRERAASRKRPVSEEASLAGTE